MSGGPAVPCSGTKTLADLLQRGSKRTIAVTANVPDEPPQVTNLNGVEVEAVYPLRNVKLVAGRRTNGVPREITAMLASSSVPVYLPPGSYLLLVVPHPDARTWMVLSGASGIFHVLDNSSAQEQCRLHGVGVDSTREEMIEAAHDARGPVEPLTDVVSALQKQLG